MRRSNLILCLWPGLGALWLRGHGSGLLTAAAAGATLNFAVLVSFVWPDVVGDELPQWLLPTAAWCAVSVWWIVGGLQSRSMLLTWATPPLDDGSERLFRLAQTEYMKGQWVPAERALAELLKKRPADCDGRLLLATTFRRMKRPDDALRELKLLSELPGAYRWEREIAEERRMLAAPVAETAAEKPEPQVIAKPNLRINPATRAESDAEDDDVEEVIALDRFDQEQRRKAA